MIDQLGRKSFPLLSDDDNLDDSEYGEKQVGFKAPPEERQMEEFLSTEDINEFWVLGETCAEPLCYLASKKDNY